MKKFIPHISVLAALVLVFAFGVAFNSGVVGAWLGRLAGIAVDPLFSVPALVSGAIFYRYRNMFLFCLGAGFAVSALALYLVAKNRALLGLGPQDLAVQLPFRIATFMVLAHTTHFLSLLIRPRSQREMSVVNHEVR